MQQISSEVNRNLIEKKEESKLVKYLFPEFSFFQHPFLCFYSNKDVVVSTNVDFTINDRLNKFIMTMLLTLSVMHTNGLIHQGILLKNIFFLPSEECFFLGDYNSVVLLENIKKSENPVSSNIKLKTLSYADDLISLAFQVDKIKKNNPKVAIEAYYSYFINKIVNEKNVDKYKSANDLIQSIKEDHKNFEIPSLPSIKIEIEKNMNSSLDNVAPNLFSDSRISQRLPSTISVVGSPKNSKKSRKKTKFDVNFSKMSNLEDEIQINK
jgi:hypothetical protein